MHEIRIGEIIHNLLCTKLSASPPKRIEDGLFNNHLIISDWNLKVWWMENFCLVSAQPRHPSMISMLDGAGHLQKLATWPRGSIPLYISLRYQAAILLILASSKPTQKYHLHDDPHTTHIDKRHHKIFLFLHQMHKNYMPWISLVASYGALKHDMFSI